MVDIINDSISKLKTYNSQETVMLNDNKNNEIYIQRGRDLLLEINRGPIFEDDNGRAVEFDSFEDKALVDILINEMSITSTIIKKLKGDII